MYIYLFIMVSAKTDNIILSICIDTYSLFTNGRQKRDDLYLLYMYKLYTNSGTQEGKIRRIVSEK